MRKELIFKNRHNNYYINKCYFQNDKSKPININEVNTEKIVLSNKTPNGERGANKYYIAYLSGGFKPLHIIIKDIKLYTNHMNVLANDNELLFTLKYGIRLIFYSIKNLIKRVLQ